MAVSLIDTLVQLARQNRTVRCCPGLPGTAWGLSCLRCRPAALLCWPGRLHPLGAKTAPPVHARLCTSTPVPPTPRPQVCTTIHQPNSIITSKFGELEAVLCYTVQCCGRAMLWLCVGGPSCRAGRLVPRWVLRLRCPEQPSGGQRAPQTLTTSLAATLTPHRRFHAAARRIHRLLWAVGGRGRLLCRPRLPLPPV